MLVASYDGMLVCYVPYSWVYELIWKVKHEKPSIPVEEHNKKEPLEVSSNVIESFQNLNEVFRKEKELAQKLPE